MIPVLSRKSLLFLLLGVFALLFGVVQSVSAATCSSYGGNPYWQKAGDPSISGCTIQYDDPTGGSDLTVCQYRVLSNGTETLGWTNAIGTCSGDSATLSIDISVGVGLNCRDNGLDKCEVQFKAEDNAGNSAMSPPPVVILDIDYTPPILVQVIAVPSPTNDATPDYAFSSTESGVITYGGDCSSSTAMAAVGNNTVTFNALAQGVHNNCTIRVTDVAGNQSLALNVNSFTIDTIAPFVTNVTSTATNGSYTAGASIPVTVAFSELVTVTGTPRLTLETGSTDAIVNYLSGSPGTILTFQYTVVAGHNSIDLDYASTTALVLNGGTIKDTAGNNANLALVVPGDANSLGANKAIMIDTIAPTVTSFTINGSTGTITTNVALNITWAASDNVGGSGIQRHELWRALDSGGSPGAWAVVPGKDNFSPGTTSTTDNPADGTYWYGIHSKDNAGNCITEDTSGTDKGHSCGGVTSDGLDTRTDKGPIKVIMDKTPPGTPGIPTATTPTQNTKPTWTWTVSAGDPSSYVVYWSATAGGETNSASVATNSFTHATVLAEGTWYMKAKAFDAVGNASAFSGNGSVIIDTTAPEIDVFSASSTILTINNATVGIPWTVEDFGGSGLKQVELWKKAPGGSWLLHDTNTSVSGSSASGSFSDTPVGDGTYEYGLHVKDMADNWCDEGGTGGGGVNKCAGSYNGAGTKVVQVDKTAPLNPTCKNSDGTPAGGTFQNKANNVTCSDTEGGVAIRYTLDGSSPTTSSTLYSAPFDVTSSATLKVAAWDPVGNRSATPDNSYVFTILHNQDPTIQGNPSDSPDPIKANVPITFTVSWNDPDAGDLTKIHICKTDVISGQTCSGGAWCDSASFSASSPTVCNYTTAAGDAGTKNYYAFVCDDENACSSSKSGTFLVDAQAPIITTFTITPQSPSWANNASPSITVTWNVSDQGGSNLDRVGVYRVPVVCGGLGEPSCTWVQVGSVVAPDNSDNWDCGATCPDRVVDNPGSGAWWYGMHVWDKAQNETVEPNPPGPKKAQVDTDKPTSQIQSPGAGAFQGSNFSVTVADLDTGGSALDTTQCTYSVLKKVGGSYQSVLSDVPRTCGAATPLIRTSDQCSAEGINACRVIVKSKDIAGNPNVISEAQNSIRDFSIDLTWPVVDKVSCSGDLGVPCASVQQGVSTVFRAAVSDNIQLANCEFLWRPTGGGSWQNMVAPNFNAVACQGGHTGNCLETFTDHAFSAMGTYDVRAQCWDSAFHTMPGDFVPVAVETLSVVASAVPSSGSVNTLFDLVGTVSGTMTGGINYKFDCDINQAPTWNLEVSSSENLYTAVDLCQYVSPSTYTAKAFVQRGVGSAEDTQNIQVSSNSIPTAINRLVDAPNPVDYCGVTGYPSVRARWTFSDADPGDTQGAYELEVFQGGNKVVDTGKKLGATQSYVFQSAGEQLLWNTTYTWQVRVWDSPNDDVSSFVSGPQFTTPSHYYPVPSFTWSPALPSSQESVQFTDQTNFAVGATGKTWSWNFGDGGSSGLQNPTHTYLQTSAFGVTLQAGDNVGSCSSSQTVNISVPFPEWQEISPF